MNYQMIITGLGGQGVLFLEKVVAQCAIDKNLRFIGTETHGMARKGGTVAAHVKIGNNFEAPLIGKGQADLILGLYPTEALRFLEYLRPDGFILTNTTDKKFNTNGLRVLTVNGTKAVLDGLINPRCLNAYVLGKAVKKIDGFPFSSNDIESSIKKLQPSFSDENIGAFRLGCS